MNHPLEHDWLVVAPWWNWGKPPSSDTGRSSRPSIQKYDTPNLVNEFLKDPQRRLKYILDDLVHVTINAPPAPTEPDGKPRRMSERTSVPLEPRIRKLFLDTHKRFYLVVCQVNCDAPGFPRVARDKVCEARFVVRRRTTLLPPESVKRARAVLHGLTKARLQQQKLEQAWSVLRGAPSAPRETLRTKKTALLKQQRTSVQARISAERTRLTELVHQFGIAPKLQGWFSCPSGADKVGFWDEVEETPDELEGELSYPMYPLIPPDQNSAHDGRFGTIYFGVVPTCSADTTARGEARFEDRTQYEIRCFVRRHKRPHGAADPCACPDRIFWSAATETYRLAPHFDLTGTGQRPVTVALPDLKDLEGQARPQLGAIFVKPPGSLMVAGNAEGGVDTAGRSGFEICSIPIPLITIVAMFVFELFLPVVMLLFGLFWMLRLKFCIPPQIDVAAGMTAELSLEASASLEIAASIEVNVNNAFGWKAPSGGGVPEEPGPLPVTDPSDLSEQLNDNYSPVALANMAFGEQQAGTDLAGVTVTRGIVWEERVSWS